MSNIFRILIVDDEIDMRESLQELLTREGYFIDEVANGKNALEKYSKNKYDLVISDIIMPEMDGIELLKNLKDIDPEVIVILITGYSSIQGAINAIKLGAEDYFTKPFKAVEIKKVIRRIYENKNLTQRNELLTQQIMRSDFPEIIGKSRVIRNLKKDINTVADSNVTVLITGESGTGKELVARALHQTSLRKNTPFVPINCAAVPNDLLESEFFGHEKGAFSGALKRKYGIFEVAENGTLFLDEIGEMPYALQAKLLRTVETKKIRRIGGTEQIYIDLRLICSTNRDLKEEIKEKRFREDLYFRLSTYIIFIAPLRDRKEDIPLIIENFIQKKRIPNMIIPPDTLDTLMAYDWPGNIRELENVLERILLISKGQAPTPDSLPADIRNANHLDSVIPDTTSGKILTLEELERDYIEKIYRICKGNKVKTAKSLDIGLKTLYRKLNKFAINI